MNFSTVLELFMLGMGSYLMLSEQQKNKLSKGQLLGAILIGAAGFAIIWQFMNNCQFL